MKALSDLFHNPLVSGGFLLLVSGAVMALLRRLPEHLMGWISRSCIVHVEIVDAALVEQVGTYLGLQPLGRRPTRARLVYASDRGPNGTSLPRIVMEPGIGWLALRFEGRVLLINRKIHAEMSDTRPRSEKLDIRYVGRDGDLARRFLDVAVAQYARLHRGATPIFIQGWDDWMRMDLPPARSLDSVILPGTLAADLHRDAEQFLARQHWYTDLGLPWRRVYQFEGPPGSGKSSIARALTGALELPLYVPDLRDPNLKEKTLALLWSRIPCRSAILLEDVDCLSFENPEGISLAGLLNVIDGPLAGEGRIVILTTNFPEKIDQRLIRRVDKRIALGPATQDQAERLYRRLRGEEGVEEFARLAAGRPMVDLQAEIVGMNGHGARPSG